MTQHLKPKLLDPLLQKKIINTLNPQKDTYWQPIKTEFNNIYNKYISRNLFFIIIILFFLLFLFYRYRITQIERIKLLYNQHLSQKDEYSKAIKDEYSKAVVDLYDKQKEYMREPLVKKLSSRVINAPYIIPPEFKFY